jgi:hypothetical protein
MMFRFESCPQYVTEAIIHINSAREVTNPTALKRLLDVPAGGYKLQLKTLTKRSLQQNAYYWGVVVYEVRRGMNEEGNDFESTEIHEFLKARFNYKEVVKVNEDTGEVKTEKIPRSTAKLTKTEFAEYIERIQQFAVEFFNIIIPNPNSQTYFDFNNE